MLDVHGGTNVDPRLQQLQHIFIALAMLAAFDIGVRQFVHQSDAGLARENRVHVHLLELRALIFEHFARHGFQAREQLRYAFTAMGFDNSDHHIFAADVPPDRLVQHGVRLAHAGSVAKKEFELAALLRRRTFFQPLLGSFWHRVYCLRKRFQGFKVSKFKGQNLSKRSRITLKP